MTDTLTKITSFINSPPGQLAAGGALGGIVWKFFKNVGDALNEKTNREIARWLRVKRFETGIVADEAVNWPGTFAKVFDRVFGEKHLSLRCFLKSCAASVLVFSLAVALNQGLTVAMFVRQTRYAKAFHMLFALGCVLFDYASLLETRIILSRMKLSLNPIVWLILLVIDGFITLLISAVALLLWVQLLNVGRDVWTGEVPSWNVVLFMMDTY